MSADQAGTSGVASALAIAQEAAKVAAEAHERIAGQGENHADEVASLLHEIERLGVILAGFGARIIAIEEARTAPPSQVVIPAPIAAPAPAAAAPVIPALVEPAAPAAAPAEATPAVSAPTPEPVAAPAVPTAGAVSSPPVGTPASGSAGVPESSES